MTTSLRTRYVRRRESVSIDPVPIDLSLRTTREVDVHYLFWQPHFGYPAIGLRLASEWGPAARVTLEPLTGWCEIDRARTGNLEDALRQALMFLPDGDFVLDDVSRAGASREDAARAHARWLRADGRAMLTVLGLPAEIEVP